MKLEFDAPETGRIAIEMRDLTVGYDVNAPLLAALTLTLRAGERVALVGPNGSGKSTLLRTLTGDLAPLAGAFRVGPSVRLGLMSQTQDLLDPARNPVETIQALAPLNETDTRNFLHYFLFSGDEALKPNAQLSYGQRARLELARLVALGCNCLLLDEPINHLDIPSRAQFEQALAQFDGAVLAVVHDRYFIDRFAQMVWRIDGRGLTVDLKQLVV